MGKNQYAKAYDTYQQLLSLNSLCPTYWLSVAIMYFHVKQLGDCLSALKHVIHLNPYDANHWYNLAVLVKRGSSDFL